LYLDFIADFPNAKLYINNKEKIEMIKDKLPVCYDGMETLNGLE